MTKLVIGLTGGIASGKTAITQLFAKRGAPILDTDEFAKALCQPGEGVFDAIVERYGNNILKDGLLDRAQLRNIIFNEPEEKQWLEALLHPLIRDKVKQEIQKIHFPYCIVAIPLLTENYPYPLIDRVLVIDCSEEIQLKRLIQRDSISLELAKKILLNQASRQNRLAIANDIIENEGSLEELEQKVEALHQFYLQL